MWSRLLWNGRSLEGAPITPHDSGRTWDRKGTESGVSEKKNYLVGIFHLIVTRGLMNALVVFQTGLALESFVAVWTV